MLSCIRTCVCVCVEVVQTCFYLCFLLHLHLHCSCEHMSYFILLVLQILFINNCQQKFQ